MVIIGRKGWERRFILRGERKVSAPKRPLFLYPMTKSVKSVTHAEHRLGLGGYSMYTGRLGGSYLGIQGGIYQGVYPPYPPGCIYRVYLSSLPVFVL